MLGISLGFMRLCRWQPALSRNYFDQIHFAINHLAMLPGFFSTKNVWRPERLLPCTWQSKVYYTSIFQGAITTRPLIILFRFLAMVLLMKSVIRWWGIVVSMYFGNHQNLKVGIFGDQHIYNICVLAINT